MRGILGRWFGFGPSAGPQLSGTANPEGWLLDIFGGMMTATGLRVSPALAMTVPAVAACVNILAEDLAKVPLIVYRRRADGGEDRATSHPLYRRLHSRSAPWRAAFHWRRAAVAAAIQHGNSFTRVVRDELARIDRLTLLPTGRTVTKWTEEGEPFFDTTTGGRVRTLSYQDVIHIPYRSDVDAGRDGGVYGVSPITRHPESIALAVATERFAAAFFRNGARPSAVVEVPGKIPNDDVASRLRGQLERLYSGMDSAFKIAILELGMKLKEFAFSNADSQLMEVRKEQAVEACRIFGVPPHKIGILDRATFSNIEHQAIEYVTGPLSALAKSVESAISIACLSEAEQEEYLVEHDLNGLLRGDIKTRYAAFAAARQWGWLSVDEIRELENLNPLPDGAGKTYLTPTNMAPADKSPPERDEDEDDEPPRRRSSLIGHNGGPLFF